MTKTTINTGNKIGKMSDIIDVTMLKTKNNINITKIHKIQDGIRYTFLFPVL